MTETKKAADGLHVGIILDGNRRWAKEKGKPSLEGHRRGYEKLKDIATHAFDRGVGTLSAYIFSTENWDRTKKEVNYLMNLALKMVTKDLKELDEKNIRVVWLGTPEKLSKKLISALKNAEDKTKNNTAGTLALCFNYGGQVEIAEAFKKIFSDGYTEADINAELISEYLYQPQVGPVDLIIRTSGEQRLSNFMLWRAAYSELYFSDKYWPDFSTIDLDNALKDYENRKRRFGK